MRRLAAILACLAVVSIASPAQADTHYRWPKTNCNVVFRDIDGSEARLCVDAYVDKLDGGGLGLQHVYIRLEGGPWESKGFDCDWLTARNDNDSIVWRKDGAECDIYKNLGMTLFHPQQNMPNSHSVLVTLAGWPKINGAQDPGYSKVSVSVSY